MRHLAFLSAPSARAARFLGVAVVLLALPLAARAQDAATYPDIGLLVQAAARAVSAGQWPLVAVLALVAAIWALRTFGRRWIPWLATSEGGTVLAFLTALGGTLGAAALGGVAITWALLASALAGAFTAMGAWTGVRRLLRALVPAARRVPRAGPTLADCLAFLSGSESQATSDAAQLQPLADTTATTPAATKGETL
jgi:hypothetical protein